MEGKRRTVTILKENQDWIYQWRGYQLRNYPYSKELDNTKALNILLSEAIEARKKTGDKQYHWSERQKLEKVE